MEASLVGAIVWLLIALAAVAGQYLYLPIASTDLGVSALVLVGLAVIVVAPVAAFVLGAIGERIFSRASGNWRGIAGGAFVSFYVVVMTAVVASPLLYFAYRTQTEFETYPASRALPVEAAAAVDACDSPVFALISDTHITDQPLTLEKKAGGESKLRKALSAIRGVCPERLIISGDLTDQGEKGEWKRFAAVLQELRGARPSGGAGPQVLFVPGNHDLQGTPFNQAGEIITKGFGRTQDEFLYAVNYLARERWFLEQAGAERVLAFAGADSALSGEFSRRVDEVLAAAAQKKQVMTDAGDMGGPGLGRTKPSFAFFYPAGFEKILASAQKRFDDLFPMIREDARSGLAIVLLNTSAHLSPGASMGLGSIGAAQFGRLEKYLSGLEASRSGIRSLVVVMHHAPLRRATDAWSWRELWERVGDSSIWAHTVLALDVNDAGKIVRLLDHVARSRPDIQVVLAHGHRHGSPYLGQTDGGVLVVEAPGVIEDQPPGFWAAYRVNGKLDFRWRAIGP